MLACAVMARLLSQHPCKCDATHLVGRLDVHVSIHTQRLAACIRIRGCYEDGWAGRLPPPWKPLVIQCAHSHVHSVLFQPLYRNGNDVTALMWP